MGRFYKTGKGDYIDFIYKQPRNLLLQAVKTAEGQIDQQAKMNADLYGQLHSAALPWDAKKRDLKVKDCIYKISESSHFVNDLDQLYPMIRKILEDVI